MTALRKEPPLVLMKRSHLFVNLYWSIRSADRRVPRAWNTGRYRGSESSSKLGWCPVCALRGSFWWGSVRTCVPKNRAAGGGSRQQPDRASNALPH